MRKDQSAWEHSPDRKAVVGDMVEINERVFYEFHPLGSIRDGVLLIRVLMGPAYFNLCATLRIVMPVEGVNFRMMLEKKPNLFRQTVVGLAESHRKAMRTDQEIISGLLFEGFSYFPE